jgi:hypothetical protein
MPEDGSKRSISAGGLVGGATAIATAIAAVLGVLNQLGYVGSHEEPKPVIILATPVAVATSVLPAMPQLPVAQASKAASTPAAQANATPVHHKHVAHKPKPPPVEEAASDDAPDAKPSVIARATPAVEAAAAVAPVPAPAPPPPEAPSASASLAMIEPPEHGLSGAWVDENIGACHLIAASGSSFLVTTYDPSTGEVMSYGDGTVDGNHISITFRGHRVMADFHMSPTHNTLYGKVTRPSGIFRSMWRYVGPACQKPSS